MNPEIAEVNQKGLFPVPGHSLTNSPENPYPFEGPPEFTDVHTAIRFMWGNLIEDDAYTEVIKMIDNEVPLMHIVKGILFVGFNEGKWDPNLMMLLTEPLMYMLLALAERAGLDPVFEDESAEMLDEYEEETKGMDFKQRMELSKLDNIEEKIKNPPAGAVPSDVLEDIKELPKEKIQSLLDEPKSLMSK